VKAFVDSREPSSMVNEFDKKFGGRANSAWSYEDKKKLPQGDFYFPEHDVVIERKEASDFASSTTDGRLSEQADRMIAEHEHCFVIIERPGEPLYDQPYSDISDRSIVGMQTSLAVKRGVKVIYTESKKHTAYAVKRIFERFADEEHKQADGGYVKTADTGEVDDVQVAMLMQIDGISEEKARKITDKYYCRDGLAGFGSEIRSEPRKIKNDLQMIDGIGPKLADRVVKSFI
jgi:ERCC4-type nuclease